MVSGAYFLNAASFIIRSQSRWHHALGTWDIGLQTFITGPTFTQFFYGLGNTYFNFNEKPKYHVVKGSRVELIPSLDYHFGYGSTFSVRLLYRFINIEDSDDEPRFIYSGEANLSPESFGARHYLGLEAGYKFERLDNGVFPSRGGSIEMKVGAQEAISREGFGNGWASLEGSLYVPFDATSTLVLSTHFGVDLLIGEYEFFQALTLGGPDRLRGYRRDRFAGDARVYHATDLRLKLFQNRSVVPFGFGVYASFDYGRVWPDAGDDSSDTLHTAFGGGVFVVPLGLTAFRLGYMIGQDDKQLNLGGALRF
jgi:outer membrane protein assembly factor BamA